MDVSELKEQAVSMGLIGEAVLKFVLDQQALLRDERAREREERAKERDAAERAKDRELKQAEINAAAEKQRLDNAAEQARLDHELELARIKVSSNSICSDNPVKPTLPVFKDGEDIASYLIRFERVAELLNLDKETYAVRLGSLLTGRAVEIYTSLSPAITKDYELLKKALLVGFSKTSHGYRQDFRSAKIRSGETYNQFAIHLGRLFDLWIENTPVCHTYDDLRNFMINDQFTASLSPELRMYIKEHNVVTLDETVRLADNWATAHNAYTKNVSRSDQGRKSDFRSGSQSTDSRIRASATPGTQTSNPNSGGNQFRGRCHACGEYGHVKSRCPKNPAAFKSVEPTVQQVSFCWDEERSGDYVVSGTVNGTWVSDVLRDTGCTCILVSEKLLPDVDISKCVKTKTLDYLGRPDYFPRVRCYIRCPYYVGWANVLRAPIKFCSVLVGNVPGARKADDPDPNVFEESVQAVQTRAAKSKRIHPLVLPECAPLDITPEEFANKQFSCPSLSQVRNKLDTGEVERSRDGSEFKFEIFNGLIYRTCISCKVADRIGKRTLVVPSDCKATVASVAHESPLAGHFSNRKTVLRVGEQFYWPGMGADIRDFCRSCDKCQRMCHKGRVRPVPLKQLPIITEPFSRVAIDLVGPLTPPSSGGHRFILTLIDFATGFPEAIPLKDIDSISVAEALLSMFSRVGIPREILSDRGVQFTSQLMGELHKLLGVKPLFTTPYHPSANGRVERLHSTLKSCLRKLCADKPKEWHRYLIPTLFALREMPSDRTGFSAFELLYGRSVRGPLTVLRDLWEDRKASNDERTSFQYVIELKDKLEDCAKIAAQNAEVSASRYKSYFDLKSQDRHFEKGDEVLLLLPDSNNKLLMAWHGPYPVVERRNKVDYVIEVDGKLKMYHVNLLKKYHRRNVVSVVCTDIDLSDSPMNLVQACSEDGAAGEEDNLDLPVAASDFPDFPFCEATSPPDISKDLGSSNKVDVDKLIGSFSDVFSETPGCTSILEHDIVLNTTDRVKAKMYPIPIHLQPYFKEEVDKLLEQGIIQLSSSPHCSPVVMVRKADNTYRMAIDYRLLNSFTVFHAEPITTIEEDLHKFAGAKYFSELDLTKAYYQIPLSERARPYTAFPTHRGLMEFCRLPFGLVTACATYIRLMRIVLSDLSNVSFYFDNIFVYGKNWEDHKSALIKVLERLRSHNLTARLSKCRFGYGHIRYLGFIVDGTFLKPQYDKVHDLLNVPPPTTKKSLRSFLGMVSFYRMFIPSASEFSAPLSNLLRKNSPDKLVWTEELNDNFSKLKQALCSEPVLKLPDSNLTFILRTDASNTSLGAVLLQILENCPFPVAYASRKLLDRERKYSPIERECLAIVFGIKRFEYYLLGKEFILEVDHKPLIYLNKAKGTNDRLVRWSLSLQPFKFRLVHIAGDDNVGADFLSRSD